jgi:two-component system response regulator YesN
MIKVLIADDEIHICRLIQALIQWDSLEMEPVGVANNGMEAIGLVKEKKPDILITDIRMPGCSGLELIKEAKQLIPDLQILIISGYAHFEYAQQAMKYGVGDYILKPIKQDELNSTLMRMAEKWKSTRSIEDRLVQAAQTSQDINRLRRSLIEDMLDDNEFRLDDDSIVSAYHVKAVHDCTYQPFEIRIDRNLQDINMNTTRVIYEKTERILSDGLKGVCADSVILFRDMAAYGIMVYGAGQHGCMTGNRPAENRDSRNGFGVNIRNTLRDAMRKAEEEAGPLGSFEFTAALGREVMTPGRLKEAFDELHVIILTRITEGTGRVYEETEAPSAIDRPAVISRFTSDIEKKTDTLSLKDTEEILHDLRDSALAVPDIRGREIYRIVIDAGRIFLSRMINGSPEREIDEFMNTCRGCGSVDMIFEALGNMMREEVRKRDEALENATVRPVREAKKYICEHYSEPVTLEEISSMLGFSPSYFSVLFKKDTGGFAKYLTQVRMDEAKRLLRETDTPVSRIAEQVGYMDQKHFTQTFRKLAGINPGEYRKLYG